MPRVSTLTYRILSDAGEQVSGKVAVTFSMRSERFRAELPPEVAARVELEAVEGDTLLEVRRAFAGAVEAFNERRSIRERQIGISFLFGPWDRGWSGTEAQALCYAYTLADLVTKPGQKPYHELTDALGNRLRGAFEGTTRTWKPTDHEAKRWTWLDWTPEREATAAGLDTAFKALGAKMGAFLGDAETIRTLLDSGGALHLLGPADDPDAEERRRILGAVSASFEDRRPAPSLGDLRLMVHGKPSREVNERFERVVGELVADGSLRVRDGDDPVRYFRGNW